MKRRELILASALAMSGAARSQDPAAAAAFSAEDLQHATHLRDLGLADGQAW